MIDEFFACSVVLNCLLQELALCNPDLRFVCVGDENQFAAVDDRWCDTPLSPEQVVRLAFLIARRRIPAHAARDVAQETWLKARRQAGSDEGLQPVVDRAKRWLDMGLRVVFTARTHTQAERLVSLLKGYDVPVLATGPKGHPAAFDPAILEGPPPAAVQIVVGELNDGFAWATEGLVVVTEQEIFGTRTRRRRQKRRRRKQKTAQAFLEDLRELKPGDYIVHADHGVGVYLGIERKPMALTPMQRLQGEEPRMVETLIVEYHGKDKLFLPVTRLNQLQKFAGKEGSKPKLDRLGEERDSGARWSEEERD